MLLSGHVFVSDFLRCYFPRTVKAVSWKSFEVKLTTDLGIGTASVRYVVAVERHQLSE
jgi:hypothetical protein